MYHTVAVQWRYLAVRQDVAVAVGLVLPDALPTIHSVHGPAKRV